MMKFNCIDEINAYYSSLLKCKQEYYDYSFVLGNGRENRPKLFFVGEAPGKDEELQGLPFVGKAGKELSGFLETLELTREEIYITNAVKFRPFKLSERGTKSNRTPDELEISDFSPWIKEEIAFIRPKIVVSLGNTPLKSLLGNNPGIGRLHGRIQEYNEETSIFPLYHPAALIYKPELRHTMEEDVALLKSFIEI